MEVKDVNFIFKEACKSLKKWGLLISFSPEYAVYPFEEVIKAAPYLDAHHNSDILFGCEGFMFFDSFEEARDHFFMTIGDDGPNESNKYNGPCKVYALVCTPDGSFSYENT